MLLLRKVVSNTVFALHILLIFLLIFQAKISLPPLVQSVGRLHPMLLHLPIGLFIVFVCIWLSRAILGEPHTIKNISRFVLYLTSLSTVITALLGLFLSTEEGYDSSLLQLHQWGGVGLSLGVFALMEWFERIEIADWRFNTALISGLVVLSLTGHWGASITHGEDFVFAPLNKEEQKVRTVSADASLYEAAIAPILESKCYTCHNERKAKGELVMTIQASLIKGGKNGPIWEAGNPDKSLMMQRIHLPVNDKKHMPPSGKAQLNEEEINLLTAWIASGADMKKKMDAYEPKAEVLVLASAKTQAATSASTATVYPFDFVPQQTLTQFNTPFRTVRQIAYDQPALQADFYVQKAFTLEALKELKPVSKEIIRLNLSNMPLKDEDLALLGQFPNLEKLILNGVPITGAGLNALAACTKLRSLSLSNTRVNATSLSALENFPQLEEVFIWNTPATEEDPSVISSLSKKIRVERGFVANEEELMVLPAPFLVNDNTRVLKSGEEIVLKHRLPGVVIRYTQDGSDPDSLTSPVYQASIPVKGFAKLKVQAFKEGWKKSSIASYGFFNKGITPDSASLLTPPDVRYPGKGSITLYDGEKGVSTSFTDRKWLGYQENPFSAYFYFSQPQPISSVVLSVSRNIGSHIFPPVSIEVWGGQDLKSMKLLNKIQPDPATKYETMEEGFAVSIPQKAYPCIKVTATPLSKIPQWHHAPKQKGWVFIDEVFFYGE